jgi:hypothetical protein
VKLIRFFSKKIYDNLGQPTTAKKHLPQWYKDSEATFITEDGSEHAGLKKCIPFLDAMLSGYMLVTPVDIFISHNEDGTPNIRWNSPESFIDFISERTKLLGEQMPRPAGHFPNHLAFRGTWGFRLPKGWSVLVTQPFNRHDLPWTLTSGLMDADQFSTSGNLPFFLRKDFVGMVPAGTPIAQVLPVKRASWKAIYNDQGLVYLDDLQTAAVRSFGNSYKKLFWQRKDYS